MLRNYLTIAVRTLWRNKTSTAINVLGLALGISACLVIYLLVQLELSYDTFHPDRERIYRVTSVFKNQDGKPSYNAGVAAPIPAAVREEVTGIEKSAAVRVYWAKVSVPTGQEPRKFSLPQWGKSGPDVLICEPEYFDLFRFTWLYGNPQTALRAPNRVVLTDRKAAQYFGNVPLARVLGRQLTYNDSLVVTVAGVVKSLPVNTDLAFNDFISYATIQSGAWRKGFQLDEWTNTNGDAQLFVRLAPGTAAAQVDAQWPGFLRKHLDQKDEWNKGRELRLQPLADIHFNPELASSVGRTVHLPTLYGLVGVAAFLLLIAAINFVNLSTAQSIRRVKEIGIRKVLGSHRSSLIAQFLSETVVITAVAIGLSVLLAGPLMWAYRDFLPTNLSFNPWQPHVVAFLSGLLVVTVLLSGLYPAWVISSYSPVVALKNQLPGGQSRTALLRKVLITFQFTFSQVFILGTVLVAAQSKFMLGKDLGFRRDAILHFQTDWQGPAQKRAVLANKLRQLPDVAMVSLSNPVAQGGYSTTTLKYNDGKAERKFDVHVKSVDTSFVPLFGLKLLAGRNLFAADTTRELVVNEAFVKAMGLLRPQEAVGKLIGLYDTKGNPIQLPVVGVVADYHFQSLHQAIHPLLFNAGGRDSGNFNVRLRSAGQSATAVAATLDKMRKAYEEVYPNSDQLFEPQFYDDTVAKFYESERKTTQLLNTATGVAILIACLGLFGLVSFATTQRTKEIGIRKVLGASVGNIVGLLSKDFLKLVGLAIAVASPLAYFGMRRWLENFAYRVDISWWIFALAGLAAVLIALVTVSYQAIKAALANPVKSLRTE